MKLAALLVCVAACGVIKSGAGEVGGTLGDVAACPLGLFDCGHVYACDTPADNELGLVEICISDDGDDLKLAVDRYGACEPTPRHEGLCRYHCNGGKGCNAFDGCFCPRS